MDYCKICKIVYSLDIDQYLFIALVDGYKFKTYVSSLANLTLAKVDKSPAFRQAIKIAMPQLIKTHTNFV